MEIDVAYTAGPDVHDIGAPGSNGGECYPREYANFLASAEYDCGDALRLERDTFGIDHCQAGLLLVSRWNLPGMFIGVTARHHDAPAAADSALLSTVRRSCMMADALGFSVVHCLPPRNFQEILRELPERERGQFSPDTSELTVHIASKINLIESVCRNSKSGSFAYRRTTLGQA